MNVTFMIGNGFDLNLGLRTKYTDFIKVYRKIQPQDDEIIKRFKNEIIGENLALWSEAELAFGKQTSSISEDFTVEDYCKCHIDFCTELAEYLRGEQKRLIFNKENLPTISSNFSKAINNITMGFRDVPGGRIQAMLSNYHSSISYNFINFNYTNTLDLLRRYTNSYGWGGHYGYTNTCDNLIHVHGTVDKDMVLGVHDESQLSNSESFKSYDPYYIGQLIKSQTDFINEENTYKNALEILNASHIIYIYGMSLGDTDKFWWENICHLLNQKKELRVILHCHEAPHNELFRGAFKRFEVAQCDKLLRLGNVEIERRDSFLERIHVTGGNIFKDLKNIVAPLSDNQAKAS